MNAGAYEGQFSDVAVEVRCLVLERGSRGASRTCQRRKPRGAIAKAA